MKRDAIWAIRLLRMAQIELSQDMIREASSAIDQVCEELEKQNGLVDEGKKLAHGIPVCICMDERGWSTCGGECQMHPPRYLCACPGCEDCDNKSSLPVIKCERKVAYKRLCVRCMPDE